MSKEQFRLKFIGDSKEIPREQHYKLSAVLENLIIYASTEEEAIQRYIEYTFDNSKIDD